MDMSITGLFVGDEVVVSPRARIVGFDPSETYFPRPSESSDFFKPVSIPKSSVKLPGVDSPLKVVMGYLDRCQSGSFAGTAHFLTENNTFIKYEFGGSQFKDIKRLGKIEHDLPKDCISAISWPFFSPLPNTNDTMYMLYCQTKEKVIYHNAFTARSKESWNQSGMKILGSESQPLPTFKSFSIADENALGYTYFENSENMNVIFMLPSEENGVEEKVVDMGEALLRAGVLKPVRILKLHVHRLEIASKRTLITILASINDVSTDIKVIYNCEMNYRTLEIAVCVEFERNDGPSSYKDIRVVKHEPTEIEGEFKTTFSLMRQQMDSYFEKEIELFELVNEDGGRELVRVRVLKEKEHTLSEAANLGPTRITFMKPSLRAYSSGNQESGNALKFFEINSSGNKTTLLYNTQLNEVFLSANPGFVVGVSLSEGALSFFDKMDNLYLKISTKDLTPEGKLFTNITKIFYFNASSSSFDHISLKTTFMTYRIAASCPANLTCFLTNESRPIPLSSACFQSSPFKLEFKEDSILPPLPVPESISPLHYVMWNGSNFSKAEEGAVLLTLNYLVHLASNKIHPCVLGNSGVVFCSPEASVFRSFRLEKVLAVSANDHWIAIHERRENEECLWVGMMKAYQTGAEKCRPKAVGRREVQMMVGHRGVYFFTREGTPRLEADFFDFDTAKFLETGILIDDYDFEGYQVGKVGPSAKVESELGADLSVAITVGKVFLVKNFRRGVVVKTDFFVPDGGRQKGSILYPISDFLVYATKEALSLVTPAGETLALYTTTQTGLSFDQPLAVLDARRLLFFRDSTRSTFGQLSPFDSPMANRKTGNMVSSSPFGFDVPFTTYTIAGTLYIRTVSGSTFTVPRPSSTFLMSSNGSKNRSLIARELADTLNNLTVAIEVEFVETGNSQKYGGKRNSSDWTVVAEKHFWRIMKEGDEKQTEGRRFLLEQSPALSDEKVYGWAEAQGVFIRFGSSKAIQLQVKEWVKERVAGVITTGSFESKDGKHIMVLRMDYGPRHTIAVVHFTINRTTQLASVVSAKVDFSERFGAEDVEPKVLWVEKGPLIAYESNMDNQGLIVVNAETEVDLVVKQRVAMYDVIVDEGDKNAGFFFLLYGAMNNLRFSVERINYLTAETERYAFEVDDTVAKYDKVSCQFTSENTFGCIFAGIKIRWRHFTIDRENKNVTLQFSETYYPYKNMVVEEIRMRVDKTSKKPKFFILSGQRYNLNESLVHDTMGILYYRGRGFEGNGYATGGISTQELVSIFFPGRVRMHLMSDEILRLNSGHVNVFFKIQEPKIKLPETNKTLEVKVLGEDGLVSVEIPPSRSFRTILIVICSGLGILMLLAFCLCYVHRRPAYFDREDVYFEGDNTNVKDNEL